MRPGDLGEGAPTLSGPPGAMDWEQSMLPDSPRRCVRLVPNRRPRASDRGGGEQVARNKSEARLLGIAKTEEFTGLSRDTLGRLVKSGRFPAPVYVGIRRLWRIEDLDAWASGLSSSPRVA